VFLSLISLKPPELSDIPVCTEDYIKPRIRTGVPDAFFRECGTENFVGHYVVCHTEDARFIGTGIESSIRRLFECFVTQNVTVTVLVGPVIMFL
jgi:hypothetical protein